MIYYNLLDGNFLIKLFEDFERRNGVEITARMNWSGISAGAHRTIFYDAFPVKKSAQSIDDIERAISKKEEFFNSLRSLPNFHVRDGITRLKTKSRGEKISEVLEQKGVDTWIAVDAMHYALAGLADEIHIYTSDSDLYPVFEALQSTNCRSRLHYAESITPSELVYSADSAEMITFSRVLTWANISQEKVIERTGAKAPGATVLDFSNENDELLVKKLGDDLYVEIIIAGRERRTYRTQYVDLVADKIRERKRKITYRELAKLLGRV